MSIKYCETENELEEEAERIEEIHFEHLQLKEQVQEKEFELRSARKELEQFEEDNKNYLF